NLVDHGEAVHAGHGEIEDHEGDVVLAGLEDFDGGAAVGTGDHLPAVVLEDVDEEIAHILLVVADNNSGEIGRSGLRKRCFFSGAHAVLTPARAPEEYGKWG